MSDISLVFNVTGRDRGVNALLTRTAANVRAANIAGAASTVALGAAMATASAHAIALGSSVLGAVGAVGLLPGAVAAAAATVVGAKAVTFGLADAWQKTGIAATGGGGRVSSSSRQVAAAHREAKAATEALASAQRAATVAQQAVTRARADEAERLEDQSRALKGARIDEEDAVAAVAKAERDLIRARQGGVPEDIAEADRAYRRAQNTLDETRDRVEDLAAEQADGARKGVEGSDAVQAALERQREAQRQVEQAAQRLADAQDAVRQSSAGAAGGGIDPAAQALARLSPNGRAVILTLRALAPAWQNVARAGQQATFRNVASDLKGLSSTYLPLATRWLVRMGSSFNTAIRQSAGLAQTRGFVADVGTVLGNTSRTTDRLARAIRPIISGLMQFAAVGSEFLPGFAGSVLTIAQRFERWAKSARESGRMQQWMTTGVAVLKDLAAIAGNVVGMIKAIFAAGDNDGSTLDALVRGSAAMRAWLESAEGQERVREVLTGLRDVLGSLGTVLSGASEGVGTFADAVTVAGPVLGTMADHMSVIGPLLPWLAAGYVALKISQFGANLASIAGVAANFGMRRALKAHTVELRANTAATKAAAGAQKSQAIAQAACGVELDKGGKAAKTAAKNLDAVGNATGKATKANKLAAAAQWLLNAAQAASPVGLIIVAIIAIAAGIYLLWTRSETFRKIVIGVWRAVWGAIKAAYDWIVANWRKLFDILTWPHRMAWRALVGYWRFIGETVRVGFNRVIAFGARAVAWFVGLPRRIGRGLRTVSSILTAPFRAGFNAIAGLWNRSVGSLSFSAPSWVPAMGGKSFSLPKLPMLAKGGTFTDDGGAAIVGENGPELITGVRGASVVPLSRGGGGVTTLRLESDGSPVADFLLAILRPAVKRLGGVRAAFGET